MPRFENKNKLCTVSDQVMMIQDRGQSQDSWQGLQFSLTRYIPQKDWPRSQCMSFPLQMLWVTSERLDKAWTKTQALLGPPPPSSTPHNHQRWFIIQTVLCCSKIRHRWKKKSNKRPTSLFLAGGLPLVTGHLTCLCGNAEPVFISILTHYHTLQMALVRINFTSQTLQLLLKTQCRRI